MSTRLEPFLGRVQDAPGQEIDLTQNVIVVGVAGDVNTRLEPALGRVYDAPGSIYDGMQVVTTVDEVGSPTMGADFDIDLLAAAGALASGDVTLVSQGGTEKQSTLGAERTFILTAPACITSISVQSNQTVNTNKAGDLFGTRYSQTTTKDIDLIRYTAAVGNNRVNVGGACVTQLFLQAASAVNGAAIPMVYVIPSGVLVENNNSAGLEVSAIFQVNSTTQGFLPPRMDESARDLIPAPAVGLVIYNTTTNKLNLYTSAWEEVTSA